MTKQKADDGARLPQGGRLTVATGSRNGESRKWSDFGIMGRANGRLQIRGGKTPRVTSVHGPSQHCGTALRQSDNYVQYFREFQLNSQTTSLQSFRGRAVQRIEILEFKVGTSPGPVSFEARQIDGNCRVTIISGAEACPDSGIRPSILARIEKLLALSRPDGRTPAQCRLMGQVVPIRR